MWFCVFELTLQIIIEIGLSLWGISEYTSFASKSCMIKMYRYFFWVIIGNKILTRESSWESNRQERATMPDFECAMGISEHCIDTFWNTQNVFCYILSTFWLTMNPFGSHFNQFWTNLKIFWTFLPLERLSYYRNFRRTAN